MLRTALYGYAFNLPRRSRAPEPATASVLAWLERNSLPVSSLSDPQVIRAALDGLCMRLDGSPAAANTITRKRAVFHKALGYAVELGLLPANPPGTVQWRAPKAAAGGQPPGRRQPRAGPGHPGPGRPERLGQLAMAGCHWSHPFRLALCSAQRKARRRGRSPRPHPDRTARLVG